MQTAMEIQSDAKLYVPQVRRSGGMGARVIMGAPDLVVEGRSPSNTEAEAKDKALICLENGCVSFWDFDRRQERLSITEGGVTIEYGIEDYAACCLVDSPLRVRELFE